MDFFGIGGGEILLILIVALIIFGPGRIVEISQTLGRMMHTLKKASSNLTAQVTKELEAEERQHLPPQSPETTSNRTKPSVPSKSKTAAKTNHAKTE